MNGQAINVTYLLLEHELFLRRLHASIRIDIRQCYPATPHVLGWFHGIFAFTTRKIMRHKVVLLSSPSSFASTTNLEAFWWYCSDVGERMSPIPTSVRGLTWCS
eukprot:6098075-Amphidinium_carterae.1